MTALDLLSGVISQGGKVATCTLRNAVGYDSLVAHGYLRHAGVIQSTSCLDCHTPHDAEIVFDEGQYGYFCPDFGFTPVQRDDIDGILPDIPHLVGQLAGIFDCKRRKESPIHGETWRVGTIETETDTIGLFFHPKLRSLEDIGQLQAALTREMRTEWVLVVTTTGSYSDKHKASVGLNDLVSLNLESGELIPEADPCTLVGVPPSYGGGRPNQYRSLLTPIIKTRLQDGTALPGQNAEAKAIQAILIERDPEKIPPAIPTIKRYLNEIRSGS